MLRCCRSFTRRAAASTLEILYGRKMASARRPTLATVVAPTVKGKERAANVDLDVDMLDLAADRLSLNERLSESDVYSILRVLQKSGDDRRIDFFLAHATRIIHSTHMHVYYLKTLLSFQTPHYTSQVVHSLCDYLESSSDPPKAFLDILWHVVYTRTSTLEPGDKLRILNMVHSKLNNINSSTQRVQKTNSLNLADPLAIALFPTSHIRARSHHILSPETKQWAAEQAKLAFAPSLPWEARWENLLLLAMCKAPPAHKVLLGGGRAKATQPEFEAEFESQSERKEEPERAGRTLRSSKTQHRQQRQQDSATMATTHITATHPSLQDWRPVLVLSSLEASLEGGDSGGSTSTSTSTRNSFVWASGKDYIPPRITPIAPGETRESVQNIVRSLWAMWKPPPSSTTTTDAGISEIASVRRRPLSVYRTIAAAFLRAVARVGDGSLAEACLRFCVEHGLISRPHDSGNSDGAQDEGLFELQVANMYVPFVLALAASQGTSWQDILDASTTTHTSTLPPPTSTEMKVTGLNIIPFYNSNNYNDNNAKRHLLVPMLLHHFTTTQDPRSAYQAYTYASERRIPLPSNVMRDLGTCLARPGYWHLAVRVLEKQTELLLRLRRARAVSGSSALASCSSSSSSLLREQRLNQEQDQDSEPEIELEPLLTPILRVFQIERYETIESSHARVIGDALWVLYGPGATAAATAVAGTNTNTRQGIPDAKYPVRFVFCILIASGYPERVIEVVEAIQKRDRSSRLSTSSFTARSSSASSAPARRKSYTRTPPSPTPPPPFFTTRLLLRIMRTLVRHRYFALTQRVLNLVPPKPLGAAEDFRRKLVLALTNAGEAKAAKEVYFRGVGERSLLDLKDAEEIKAGNRVRRTRTREVRRTARELMIKAVKFKTRHPLPRTTVPIAPMVLSFPNKHTCCRRVLVDMISEDSVATGRQYGQRNERCNHCTHNRQHNPSTLRYALLLLTRAHRTYSALKLLRRWYSSGSGGELDTKTRTDIGNMILHSYLERAGWRNGRVVRRVLRMKKVLESEEGMGMGVGFKPDRVTVNILVKAVLRWKAVESREVRGMFDHLVRYGYPASKRWRVDTAEAIASAPAARADVTDVRAHGDINKGISEQPSTSVFGTLSSSFDVSVMHRPLSFERHVRPLYKMFARAFFVRGDAVSAQTVLRILREEEAVAVRRREERNKARRSGLVRKKRGETKHKTDI